MRGYPLSRLIDERIKYLSKGSKSVDEAAAIRGVMDEVEQTARCMMRLAVFVGITLFCLAAWALVARLCGII